MLDLEVPHFFILYLVKRGKCKHKYRFTLEVWMKWWTRAYTPHKTIKWGRRTYYENDRG